jgi:hypothetical protein
MIASATRTKLHQLSLLLRGDLESLRAWTEASDPGRLGACVAVILVGSGFYGAAMGYWRAPLQSLFVAAKFPLIILLTTSGNALLNGMLAPLLGLDISFRQSCLAILLSFTIASAILGSFSPVVAFLIWNAPHMSALDGGRHAETYSFIQLMHVAVIAFAGLAANLRLMQLLRVISRNRGIAVRVLVAWLAGNLFLGSQLSWLLRPFIGSPGLPVQFLRPSAFKGNFYETVFHSLLALFRGN